MTRSERTASVDPRLDAALRYACAIGLLLVALLPAARGSHAVLGWLPLWLVAMPCAAWWAAHRFALPWRRERRAVAGVRARRVRQARRVARPVRDRIAYPHAA